MAIFKIGLCCLTLMTLSIAAKQEPQKCCSPNFFGHRSTFPVGGDAALALDFFRSLPDGSWAGNSGAYASLNLAAGDGRYGIGGQVGGSYGLYDWNGRGSNPTGNTSAFQQQAFLTVGLFRRTPHCSGVNAGIVYDAMFNKQFSVFGLKANIGQVRGQFGYLIEGGNELGLWATYETQTAHSQASELPVEFRAICQVNLFWTHSFKNRAVTMLWAGTPYRRGLMFTSGRAGSYIVGANFKAPLTTALSIVGHGSYMGGRSDSMSPSSQNYAANLSFGLNYSFGGCNAGQRPYLYLADNSNFLVDTNVNE